MTSIKTAAPLSILCVLAIAALAGPTQAQIAPSGKTRGLAPGGGAAATLPNTFEGPAAAQPVAPTAQVTDAEMAEAALRAVIEQFRTADIDERLFTPGVATQLNGQLAEYSRLVRGYGAVRSIEPQGANGGVGQFLVLFDNAVTQWQVGLEEGGLVAAIRFREAPPESSDPAAPAAPAS